MTQKDRIHTVIEMIVMGGVLAAKIDEAKARGHIMHKTKMVANQFTELLERDLKPLFLATYENEGSSEAFNHFLGLTAEVVSALSRIDMQKWGHLLETLHAVENGYTLTLNTEGNENV
jgi:hypothetical protein